MIISNSLIYKPVLQRPANNNNSLNFLGSSSRVANKCVLPQELQTRLHQLALQYDFASTKPAQVRIKRAMDIISALIGLVLTSPIMVLSATAIKLESKGPVIFRQKRVGRMGEEFVMYKFRSMKNTPDISAKVINREDPRITRIGRILRRFSIDEFPQLWNILKGDMSLVGPRPRPLSAEMELFTTDADSVRGLVVTPGASLNYGQARENIPKKIEIERAYLDNWSLKRDIKHLFGICKKIVFGKNY